MTLALAGAAFGSLICAFAVSLMPAARQPQNRLRGRRLTVEAEA